MNGDVAAILYACKESILTNMFMPSILVCVIVCTVLTARQPVWMVIAFINIKACYVQILSPWLVEKSDLFFFLPAVNALVFPLLGCALIMFVFRGDVIKSILTVIICEPVSMLIGFFSQRLTEHFLPQQSMMIIPVFLVVSALLYYLVRPLLLICRVSEIRHKKMAGALLVTGLSVSSLSYFINIEGLWKYGFEYVILSMGWFLTISLIILFFLMRDNRQVSMEGKYLKLQQSLIDTNYRLLKQTRIQDYERMIRELDEQMKKLQISNSAEKSVKIQNYLTHLEQEYASLRSGIYCDDPMIDAVLCYQAGILERSGVAFSCHCQDYARGCIEESDLAQILLRMLETAAQTCPELNEQNAQNSDNPPCSAMTLGISSLKGQLILHMSLTTGNSRPLKMQWMKPWLKKYSGALRQECQNGCRDVVVGLAMGEE